jgi:uncharacterized protein YdeI (YjbR/CyaY-like superfamily)
MERCLYFKNQQEWRDWLEGNHDKRGAAWLILSKRHGGKPGLSYEGAVEEALRYGWIDSLTRRMDDERFALRFTPRKPDSVWSKNNRERTERMIREGRMTEAGLAIIKAAKKGGRWGSAYRLREDQPTPKDLEEALQRNRRAYDNFRNFAQGYRNQYIYWVNFAKKMETRRSRIQAVVRRAEENKKPGV